MLRNILLLSLLCLGAVASAADSIYKAQAQAPLEQVYRQLYQALETQRLWVVFEADLGANLSGMAGRLGENYNRNELQGIRSMVVCSPWYANEASNLDPNMLALCPLRLGVIHKDGVTSVLFARPTLHAADSPALPVVEEIEGLVIEAIDRALGEVKGR